MKRLIMILVVALTYNAKAEVIVSLAVKQGNGTKETTNNTNTEVTKNGNNVTKSVTNTDSDVSYSNKVNTGLLVQGLVNDLSIGVGYFNDNTGMATVGWRFK